MLRAEIGLVAYRNGEAVDARVVVLRELPSAAIEVRLGDDLIAEGEGSDLFDALVAARRILERSGILLGCKGAGLKVRGSGMVRDWSNGRVAYALDSQSADGKMERVDIFDPAPLDSLATVDDQSAWFMQWYRTPTKPK